MYGLTEEEKAIWFDEQGKRFLTAEERIQQSEEKRFEAEEKIRKLAEMLKQLGVDPESLT